VAGKGYYLLMAFADRLFRRGAAKRDLMLLGAVVVGVFWAYSALLYVNVIYFPWPLPRWYGGTDWMLNSGLPLGLARSATSDVLAVVVFATYPVWFYLGTELGLAGHRLATAQRLKERDRIIRELVSTTFPEGGAIPPGAGQVGTAPVVESLLTKIPPLYDDALTLLLFVFDSRFFVLAFTGKWKRFVDLEGGTGPGSEKQKYMDAWQSNPNLSGVAEVLRITVSYGYYTRPPVYKLIDYSGPIIPSDPPWYNPGPGGAEP
jgi:hypothetical protein